ncbi:hypothetical protein ANK1_4186 [plant metagenome]|uniref:Uncharacterized protein n=1 Tax=plant metagenome TaxID=1297885 RepID=A0A484Q6U4_9ZZZZ
MIVHLNTEGQLSLAERDDFKRLHCEFAQPISHAPAVRQQLAGIAEIEGTEAAWIELDWMRRQAPPTVATWLHDLEQMLARAKLHGWVSPDGRRVRAHVIWAAPQTPAP